MTTLFNSTSPSEEAPSLITVSFAQDPSASLGAQLKNLDNDKACEQFNPAYATVDRLIHGETVARKCGLAVGDCIVAVNGQGFRRFAPDYEHNNELDELLTNLDGSMNISFDEDAEESSTSKGEGSEENGNGDKVGEGVESEASAAAAAAAAKKEQSDEDKRLKYRVIPSGIKGGEAYKALIRAITEIKRKADPENPLMLSLERYGWDSRVNAWPRFLMARSRNVPMAMKMIQEHEQWKSSTFPIDLRRPGLQTILKSKAIAQIDIENVITPPTVYVDFGKLLGLIGTMASTKDIVDSFLIHTELLLSKSSDPTRPKLCQFIDLASVNVQHMSPTLLKEFYEAFEPNYPEVLHRLVMYPCTRVVRQTAKVTLSFVNDETKGKFVFTDDLDVVCKELGWYRPDVEAAGGIANFMKKHQNDLNEVI